MTFRNLDHAEDELVDEFLTVAVVTTLDVVPPDLSPATLWLVHLEWPKEPGGVSELWADGVDLVGDIFDGLHAELLEGSTDDGVGGEGDPLVVDLSVALLEDELPNDSWGWVAVGDVWLDLLDHLDGGLVELDEDGVALLPEAEELEDLANLWSHGGDTTDPDEEGHLGLGWDVEATLGGGLLLGLNKSLLVGNELGGVLLGAGEDALGAGLLLSEKLVTLLVVLDGFLLLALLKLADGFWKWLGHHR